MTLVLVNSIMGKLFKNNYFKLVTYFKKLINYFWNEKTYIPKLALALQFIVTNAYFSVAQTLTLVLHATLK